VGQTAPRTGIGDYALYDHCLVCETYSIFKQTQMTAENSIIIPKMPVGLASVMAGYLVQH